ncbi:MAG: TetR/AcrR family transcriptional regulator [Kofleriaceae bacterium]
MTSPKLTPRKAPRQVRAQATVEAILGAAELLTRQLGVEEWTTNHAAERAGVSIGSLYQYFPSKESLVTSLYLHRRGAHLAHLATALSTLGDAQGRPERHELAAARAWLGLDVAEEGVVDWELDAALRDFLLRAGAARKLTPIEDKALRLLEQVARRQGAAPVVAERRAFVVLRAIEGAIAAAAKERPAWLGEERFAEALAILLQALRG